MYKVLCVIHIFKVCIFSSRGRDDRFQMVTSFGVFVGSLIPLTQKGASKLEHLSWQANSPYAFIHK